MFKRSGMWAHHAAGHAVALLALRIPRPRAGIAAEGNCDGWVDIRPGIRLKEQNDADKMWIRDLFLKHKAPHEKYVVHGHTPVRKPDVQSNRINIDTALVFGGRLTAAVFEDSQAEAVDLLQVKTMSLEQQI